MSKKIIIILLFIGILSFLYIYKNIKVMEINREIINLKREIENIENENKLMQIELLSLKSPQRLEKIAKEYEFILPTKFEIIEVEK